MSTKYRLTISHQDDHQDDPISDQGLFQLHMFSTRLINYTDPDELLGCQFEYPEKLDEDGDVDEYAQECGYMPTNHEPTDHEWIGPEGFMVSYFEHGSSEYGLVGSMTGMPDFRWDGVEFAGFLEVVVGADEREWWNRLATEEAEGSAITTQREIAESALSEYTNWANGEVYGYTIEEVTEQTCDLGKTHREYEDIDSCWGFIGFEWFQEAVRDAMPDDATPENTEIVDEAHGMAEYGDWMPGPNCEVEECGYRAVKDGTRCHPHTRELEEVNR